MSAQQEENGQWILKSLTVRGIKVNGKLLAKGEEHVLKHGDIIVGVGPPQLILFDFRKEDAVPVPVEKQTNELEAPSPRNTPSEELSVADKSSLELLSWFEFALQKETKE